MEDNTNRLDKTIGDLTVKDVIVIGAVLYTANFCRRVAYRAMAPKIIEWTEKLNEKSEKMKAESERLDKVFPSKNK